MNNADRPTPPAGTGPVGEVRRSADGVTAVAISRWGSTHLRWHIIGEDPEHTHLYGWRCDRDVAEWEILGNACSLAALGREELARILHDANSGSVVPDDDDPTRYSDMADAVLERLTA